MCRAAAVKESEANLNSRAATRYHGRMEIILASASPRRRMLLQAVGLAVEVCPQHVDESALNAEPVEIQVQRLSKLKAATCSENTRPVIAADTLVALNGDALGQPRDLTEAKAMLKRLSGQTHQVYTGICVRRDGQMHEALICTHVTFRDVSEAEIDIYLQHNEVMDKAGAYAVQGGAASFIENVDGPLDNVIGLPVQQTLELLHRLETA